MPHKYYREKSHRNKVDSPLVQSPLLGWTSLRENRRDSFLTFFPYENRAVLLRWVRR